MKGKYKYLVTAAMTALLLAACGDDENSTSSKVSNELEPSQETKMIVDELNREVEIPAQLNNVVMGNLMTLKLRDYPNTVLRAYQKPLELGDAYIIKGAELRKIKIVHADE